MFRSIFFIEIDFVGISQDVGSLRYLKFSRSDTGHISHCFNIFFNNLHIEVNPANALWLGQASHQVEPRPGKDRGNPLDGNCVGPISEANFGVTYFQLETFVGV